MAEELRCEHKHLQATLEDGVLYVACASCSHAARKAGNPSPVVHAFRIEDLYGKEANHEAKDATQAETGSGSVATVT